MFYKKVVFFFLVMNTILIIPSYGFSLYFINGFLIFTSALSLESSFLPNLKPEVRSNLRGLFSEEELPPIGNKLELTTYMEQQKNFPLFLQNPGVQKLKMGAIKLEDYQLDFMPNMPESIKKTFTRNIGNENYIMTPVHPDNKSSKAIGYEIVTAKSIIPDHLSELSYFNLASRSKLAMNAQGEYFGLKMATDHILAHIYQPGKLDLDGEIDSSLKFTVHIDHMDNMLGAPQGFVIQKELGVFKYKTSGHEPMKGFIIRDMSLMQNGDVYIPAFSIPYVGRKIAEHNKKSFDEFWNKNYAYELGRVKAQLLLRYGMQMETPNSQNILVQFDENLNYRGIVLRDITDNNFVAPVMEVIDPLNPTYLEDKGKDGEVKNYLFPFTANSLWRFDEAPNGNAVPKAMIRKWSETHLNGYLDQINSALNVNIRPLSSLGDQAIKTYKNKIPYSANHNGGHGSENDILFVAPILDFLQSDIGKKKLKEYHQSLAEKERLIKSHNSNFTEMVTDPLCFNF